MINLFLQLLTVLNLGLRFLTTIDQNSKILIFLIYSSRLTTVPNFSKIQYGVRCCIDLTWNAHLIWYMHLLFLIHPSLSIDLRIIFAWYHYHVQFY